MMSRRGYGSSELNTDDFVLNASINQPFFKGKLIARIEAFDLLHQLSNTQYTVNAQGRTETRPTRIGSASGFIDMSLPDFIFQLHFAPIMNKFLCFGAKIYQTMEYSQ